MGLFKSPRENRTNVVKLEAEAPPVPVEVAGPGPELAERAAAAYAVSMYATFQNSVPPAMELKKQGMEFMREMNPRDPVEQLLVGQMLLTHARILYLNRRANHQQDLIWSEQMQSAADRAANVFRKQVQTLREYRQPSRRRRSSFTSIRTANISAQQVISQDKETHVHVVNETKKVPPEIDGSAEARTRAGDPAGPAVD